MAHRTLPTVAIAREDGSRVLVNEEDFDPEVHTRWEERGDTGDPAGSAGEYEIQDKGGGWKAIIGPEGEEVDTVRGQESAETRIEEMRADG